MAAEACADAGNVEKGVEFALDVEQLVYEVNTFLNAASMINRIAKTDRPFRPPRLPASAKCEAASAD
jgi:hypothetical protein